MDSRIIEAMRKIYLRAMAAQGGYHRPQLNLSKLEPYVKHSDGGRFVEMPSIAIENMVGELGLGATLPGNIAKPWDLYPEDWKFDPKRLNEMLEGKRRLMEEIYLSPDASPRPPSDLMGFPSDFHYIGNELRQRIRSNPKDEAFVRHMYNREVNAAYDPKNRNPKLDTVGLTDLMRAVTVPARTTGSSIRVHTKPKE